MRHGIFAGDRPQLAVGDARGRRPEPARARAFGVQAARLAAAAFRVDGARRARATPPVHVFRRLVVLARRDVAALGRQRRARDGFRAVVDRVRACRAVLLAVAGPDELLVTPAARAPPLVGCELGVE